MGARIMDIKEATIQPPTPTRDDIERRMAQETRDARARERVDMLTDDGS